MALHVWIVDLYMAKNLQPVAMLFSENRVEQGCAAYIIQGCQQYSTTLLHVAQAHHSTMLFPMLLTTIRNISSTTCIPKAHSFCYCINVCIFENISNYQKVKAKI